MNEGRSLNAGTYLRERGERERERERERENHNIARLFSVNHSQFTSNVNSSETRPSFSISNSLRDWPDGLIDGACSTFSEYFFSFVSS